MPRPSKVAPSGELRDGFKFRAGRLALDLPASLAGRVRGTPTELLRTPDDLRRWLVAAGLAASGVAVGDEDLASARALREALYRLARARVDGRPGPAEDRRLVNRWAARPVPAPRLDGHGALTWAGRSAGIWLAVVARDGVELLGGPDAARLRACTGEGCSIIFLDGSRGGRRRWCSMAACGNRAKVGEFRSRARAASRRRPRPG